MGQPRILSIDQGTSSTKAVLIDAHGTIHATALVPLASFYPRPGWAEQSAEAIWQSVCNAIADIIEQEGSGQIVGIAIANQRESLVVWDAATGAPIGPCILWQCLRTADVSARLHQQGHNAKVESRTGLSINPLFPAAKLGWVMQHIPIANELLKQGRLRAGTVDSWLLWNLTDGASFATDHSNASRTQLFDTRTLDWDAELCELFGAPLAPLARPLPSDSAFGTTAGTTALPSGIPVHAMMGDSHAALYGHGVRVPGIVKATFGTGSSLMALTPGRIASKSGLSGTIAWSEGGKTAYAIEGIIKVSAQAAAFVAATLGLRNVDALSDLAKTVDDSAGVTFVPALAGLGAPHWNDRATGSIDGLTLASTPAHIARATFDAIAMQVVDVFLAMERDTGQRMESLLADGGASANGFLMQLQADLLGRPVTRKAMAEVGAIGAAAMAFRALNIDTGGLADSVQSQTFSPTLADARRNAIHLSWSRAIEKLLAV